MDFLGGEILLVDKEKDWKTFSNECRDQLLEMSAAAKKKDEAKVTALMKTVDASCEKCHDKYE